MVKKHWSVAQRLDDDLIQHLFKLRGLDTPQQQQDFANPNLSQLPSPQIFPHIQIALQRIEQAIAKQEQIYVWGDFDADGVTSTAILWQTLHSLGAKVLPYIPQRDSEGHGFSSEGIKQLQQAQTKLVITCDHGITAFNEITQLTQQGIEVILTDHHQPLKASEADQLNLDTNTFTDSQSQYVFPPALAVIHPEQTDLGALAGCGVAYILSYAIWLAHHHQDDTPQSRQDFADRYIELAAIGTIADMMPLTGTNRVLAAEGLKRLPATARHGLQQLYQVAKMAEKEQFTTYDIGFLIAPRLNAPGRLADPLESLRLLCSPSQAHAYRLAQTLQQLNIQRQELLKKVSQQAIQQAEDSGHDGVFIVSNPDWPAGVCGLAAGRVVEKFYRPAVVMQEQGEFTRGSARSIKGFDITAALKSISPLLESFGGHAMAAGFVAKTANLAQIQEQLSQLLFQQLTSEQLQPQLEIDAQINLSDINWDVFQQLQVFEPCGMANRQPVFTSQAIISDCQSMGQDGQHLRLTLDDPATTQDEEIPLQIDADQVSESQVEAIFSTPTTTPIQAVAFNFGHLQPDLSIGSTIDLAYTINKNSWRNRHTLQLMVKDLTVSKEK